MFTYRSLNWQPAGKFKKADLEQPKMEQIFSRNCIAITKYVHLEAYVYFVLL